MTALDQESGADRANGSGVGRRGFLSLGGGGVLRRHRAAAGPVRGPLLRRP